jgi:SAM-dependent methyltransferase
LRPELLQYLCDPVDGSELQLCEPVSGRNGVIVAGTLVSRSGRSYPIRNGIPRFSALDTVADRGVDAFGDQWNYFNFDHARLNWAERTVRNTFGGIEYFRDKTIVDAGAGSGMQSRWMAEAGARHVISLELSHSVDGVMTRNLGGLENVDIVQCSIDQVPIRSGSICGLVICHNVIQHTPSVERTAAELWRIVGPSGELAFNCYGRLDSNPIWLLRFRMYQFLRRFLASRSFSVRLAYARTLSLLRFVPIVGWVLERSLLMVRGDVPRGPHYLRRSYISGVLNTFDWYGGHRYQHHKSEKELLRLVTQLQPDSAKTRNLDAYFSRPQPAGCAIRLTK